MTKMKAYQSKTYNQKKHKTNNDASKEAQNKQLSETRVKKTKKREE